MDRKYLHYLWSERVKPINPVILLVLFVVAAGVCVFALRANNVGMIDRRNAVYAADKKGEHVEETLRELRAYVYAHMNTEVASGKNPVYPPIQLQYTYTRLVEAEQRRANEAGSAIYTDAQNYCEKLYPDSFSGGPRVPCIQQYVTDHGVQTKHIPDSLYKFDFISPTWSPDLAGWSLVAAVILGVLAALRLLIGYFAKRFL